MDFLWDKLPEDKFKRLHIKSPEAIILKPEKVYFVEEGRASLFASVVYAKMLCDKRRFLCDFTEGELVFPPVENEVGFSWIMTAVSGSKIIEIDLSLLQSLNNDDKNLHELAMQINKWTAKLLNALKEKVPPRNAIYINGKEPFKINEGDSLRGGSALFWVKFSGSEYFCYGHEEVPSNPLIPFPLSGNSWITAKSNADVVIEDSVDLIKNKSLWDSLNYFHGVVLNILFLQRINEKKADKEKIANWVETENKTIKKAVNQLFSVTESEKKRRELLKEEIRYESNNLLSCCRLIGENTGINFIKPPEFIKGRTSNDPLGDIVRASKVRSRKILLHDNWWKEENGSLLAYMEEDNRPVALIQKKPGIYEMYDPVKNQAVVVNDSNKVKLKSFGYYFYRSFPLKILTLKEIFKFGFAAVSKSDLVSVLLLGVAGGILALVAPVITGVLFNTVIPEMDKGQLFYLGFILVGSVLAAFFFSITQSIAMLRIEAKIQSTLQTSVWDRLLDLPLSFFRRFSSGDLSHRALSIHIISQMLSGVALGTLLAGAFSFLTLFLLFFYEARLALTALIMVVFAVIIIAVLGYYQVRYQRITTEKDGKSLSLVLQLLKGVSKFRVAGAESRAFKLWSEMFREFREASYRARLNEIKINLFNTFLPVITTAVLFTAVILYSGWQITPGNFIAFNAAFTGYLMSVLAMSAVIISILSLFPLIERLKPVFETMPEVSESSYNPGELTGDIKVDNLNFRYDYNGPLILEGLSFTASPGEFLAVVGPSGCGKSTLLRCLLGFEKPGSGMIYYDGHSIDSVDIRMVRRQMGVVLQNGKLMAADIFTNICGSSSKHTLEDAWEAARGAGLEEDILKMPMGMFTFINEGSTTISGGQRQRLLIARAIINRPRIIYFDEATSALDNLTQAIVSDTLDSLQATRIVIAHRLSTIKKAHRIIVMEKGRIVQEGSYNKLISQKGLFAELAKRQLA